MSFGHSYEPPPDEFHYDCLGCGGEVFEERPKDLECEKCGSIYHYYMHGTWIPVSGWAFTNRLRNTAVTILYLEVILTPGTILALLIPDLNEAASNISVLVASGVLAYFRTTVFANHYLQHPHKGEEIGWILMIIAKYFHMALLSGYCLLRLFGIAKYQNLSIFGS